MEYLKHNIYSRDTPFWSGTLDYILWGAGIAQLVVLGLAVHGVAGSILLWGNFPVEGIFPLGVNMGSNSIPPKTPSDKSINRGLVCAYMHFIARTQKILTFMS